MGLTQQQHEHLQKLYSWLQQVHGLTMVRLRPNREAVERVHKLATDSNFAYHLNLAGNYAKEFPSNERELVQNFRDRCAELSRTQYIQLFSDPQSMQAIKTAGSSVGVEQVFIVIEDLGVCTHPNPPANAEVLSGFWEHQKPYILGHIVQYIDHQGRRCLDICNHATVLKPDVFSMGGGDKADKSHTAGHFGEGMKVQINRLIERGLEVSYTTGPCVLHFKHACQRHCDTPTLHMYSSPAKHHGHPSRDHTSLEETVCSISGPVAKCSPINTSQYLFLQPARPTGCSPLRTAEGDNPNVPAAIRQSKLMQSLALWNPPLPVSVWYPSIHVRDPSIALDVQFLFEPDFWGKIFIHGIFVKEERGLFSQGLQRMGINFGGSTIVQGRVGELNRDRGSLNVGKLLAYYLPEILACLERQTTPETGNTKIQCLLRHIYLEAMETNTTFGYLSTSRDMYSYMFGGLPDDKKQAWGGIERMSKELGELLGPSQGLIEEQGQRKVFPCSTEATQGQQAELLLLGYQPVPASQLLLQLWKNTNVLPTIAQLWEAKRIYVDRMQDAMESWDADQRAQGDKLLNTLAGILLNVGPELGIAATVEAWRKSMKVLEFVSHSIYHTNVVIPFKGNCSTGVGPLLVIEAQYLKSLDAVHRHRERNRLHCHAGTAGCGGKCILELLVDEAIAALTKMGVNQQLVQRCIMGQLVRAVGDHYDRLGGDAEIAGPGVPLQPQTGNAQRRQEIVVQAIPVGQGPCSDFTAPETIDTGAARSLQASQLATPPVVKGRAGGRDTLEVTEVEEHYDEADLHFTGTVLADHGAVTALLYLPVGKQETAATLAAATKLYRYLAPLMVSVFAAPSVEGHTVTTSFYIFYDPDRSAIAFNRSGELWFNAAVQVNISDMETNSEGYCRGLLRYWYLVCCHELAHNEVSNHGRRFADACSAITLHYAAKYRKLE